MNLTTYCGLNSSAIHEHASDCYLRRLPGHRPGCDCPDRGLASAPACPPRNLAEVAAYLAGRIEDAKRDRNNLDGEWAQSRAPAAYNRATGRYAGRLDALVEVFDWVRTGEAIEREQHTAITALVTEALAGSVTGEAEGFTHVYVLPDPDDEVGTAKTYAYTPRRPFPGPHRADCDANRTAYGHRVACRCKDDLPPLSETELRALWGDA